MYRAYFVNGVEIIWFSYQRDVISRIKHMHFQMISLLPDQTLSGVNAEIATVARREASS